MKVFDPRAALAEIRKEGPTPATPATQAPPNPPHVAKVADVAAFRPETSKTADNAKHSQPQDMRHGFAVNGYAKTWTGNIVSLDAWRWLSEWQRHGPDGRVWDGIAKKWRKP